MEEQVEVKTVEANENVSTQEKEANVLQEAIDKGEVDSNYGFQEDGVYRVNVDTPPPKKEENAVQEQSTDEIPVRGGSETSEEVQEKNEEEPKELAGENKQEEENKSNEEEQGQEIDSPLELIKDTEEKQVEQIKQEEEIVEEVQKAVEEKNIYPEDIEKLVSFMQETGGSLEDYVSLNKDYSKLDNATLIYEYLRQTKPHLNSEDINFLMQKDFAYDEETADQAEIKAKQLAFKEKIYEAQKHFTDSKEKYYADLKLRKQNSIPEEYKDAVELYNNNQEALKEAERIREDFTLKTNKVFNDEFKGFDFKVGENKYRFKIDNPLKVKESQSDFKNFANLFMDKEQTVIEKPLEYHKALYVGANADKIANHFYEQGRADAIKDAAKKAKNIDMQPRVDNSSISTPTGQKIKVVSGNSSDKLRIKWTK